MQSVTLSPFRLRVRQQMQCCAPCTRNCSANIVLPEPGPPTSSVVRLRGKPPPVISSKPMMPVAALAGALPTAERADFICFPEEARSLSRRWPLTNASVLGRCAAWDSITAPFAIAPDLRGGAKIAVARSLYPFTVAFALKANQARRAAVDGAAATRATAPDVECARRSRIRS